MKDEELKAITDSISDKIGEENSGMIADDLGKLFTLNKQAVDTMSKMESEVSDLKSRNEKLVLANGNLLQSIPMGREKDDKEEKDEYKPFDFRSIFDEKGQLKK